MATSLGFTAGVLVLCYSLLDLKPEEGTASVVECDRFNSILALYTFSDLIAHVGDCCRFSPALPFKDLNHG